MTSREFTNNFPSFDERTVLLDSSGEQIASAYADQLNTHIDGLIQKWEHGIQHDVDKHDTTLYTGTAGIALTFWHLYKKRREAHYLTKAEQMVADSLKRVKGKRNAYLCGDAGPFTAGALIYHETGNKSNCKDCIARLHAMCDDICNDSEIPDEVLYGRAGYLCALLLLRRHLGHSIIEQSCIDKVFKVIIASGQKLSSKLKSRSPLKYQWHGKYYLGAAHGMTGIMYVLMQLAEEYPHEMNTLVKPTVDYLASLRFPSGNYPSSIESQSGDVLVHWCHGAPGFLFMFGAAYKVFKDETYLQAAVGCGEVIWNRGLLKKGYGICHGVSGNAYTFLHLYKLTGNLKHLYRAVKFAEWCFDYGKHGCRIADRPFSLFEGMAGTIYFLSDMIEPRKSAFPAFEL